MTTALFPTKNIILAWVFAGRPKGVFFFFVGSLKKRHNHLIWFHMDQVLWRVSFVVWGTSLFHLQTNLLVAAEPRI